MPKIGSIPSSSVNPLSRSAPELTTKNPLSVADEDRFVQDAPVRLGRSDVVKPPVAPPRLSLVEDSYDTDHKRREILNRNGLVLVSDLSTKSWPYFDRSQLQEIRNVVEAENESKYFLAYLGATLIVDSFTSKAEWYERALELAPSLINASSILNANEQTKEAQLECIDNIIVQLDD